MKSKTRFSVRCCWKTHPLTSTSPLTRCEAEFISEIIRRSGCGLLLDINNVYVSATNQGFSASGFLDALPVEAIGQIHLAGHSADQDEAGNCLLIDSHNQPVAQPVWELYDVAIEKFGAIPTLIEWDDDLPEFTRLQAEAKRQNKDCELLEIRSIIVWQAEFALSLRDADTPPPAFLRSASGIHASRRFAVYRNNVYSSLVNNLSGWIPGCRQIGG